MPVCAKDQVVKIEVASNGCKRFICGKWILKLFIAYVENYNKIFVQTVNRM